MSWCKSVFSTLSVKLAFHFRRLCQIRAVLENLLIFISQTYKQKAWKSKSRDQSVQTAPCTSRYFRWAGASTAAFRTTMSSLPTLYWRNKFISNILFHAKTKLMFGLLHVFWCLTHVGRKAITVFPFVDESLRSAPSTQKVPFLRIPI